jgi:hypothetical protein
MEDRFLKRLRSLIVSEINVGTRWGVTEIEIMAACCKNSDLGASRRFDYGLPPARQRAAASA